MSDHHFATGLPEAAFDIAELTDAERDRMRAAVDAAIRTHARTHPHHTATENSRMQPDRTPLAWITFATAATLLVCAVLVAAMLQGPPRPDGTTNPVLGGPGPDNDNNDNKAEPAPAPDASAGPWRPDALPAWPAATDEQPDWSFVAPPRDGYVRFELHQVGHDATDAPTQLIANWRQLLAGWVRESLPAPTDAELAKGWPELMDGLTAAAQRELRVVKLGLHSYAPCWVERPGFPESKHIHTAWWLVELPRSIFEDAFGNADPAAEATIRDAIKRFRTCRPELSGWLTDESFRLLWTGTIHVYRLDPEAWSKLWLDPAPMDDSLAPQVDLIIGALREGSGVIKSVELTNPQNFRQMIAPVIAAGLSGRAMPPSRPFRPAIAVTATAPGEKSMVFLYTGQFGIEAGVMDRTTRQFATSPSYRAMLFSPVHERQENVDVWEALNRELDRRR
ncbi:MAG: hypothetical protein AB7S36_14255 [Planctomycetota bacterium]